MKVLITWAEVTDREAFFHFSKWSQEAKAAHILHVQQVHTHPHSFSQPHVCVWSVKLGPTFSGSAWILLKIYVSGTKIQHFIKRVTFKRHWETKSPTDSINEAFWSPPLELDHFGKHVSTFLIVAHFSLLLQVNQDVQGYHLHFTFQHYVEPEMITIAWGLVDSANLGSKLSLSWVPVGFPSSQLEFSTRTQNWEVRWLQ